MSTDAGREPGTPSSRPRRALPRLTRLAVFMAVVTLTGLPIAGWVCAHLAMLQAGYPLVDSALLVLVLVAGELMPIEIARRGRRSDEITISSTFALALIFVAPLGI